jgi:DNA-binding CsgD family transcriptional regulator
MNVTPLTPKVKWLRELLSLREFDEKVQHLTAREQQVLRLLCDGYTNRETAQVLQISVRTVEAHRRQIMTKFPTYSLVTMAASLGKVELMYTLHQDDWIAMAESHLKH